MSKSIKRCENCDAPKGKPCPRWVDATWGFFKRNVITQEMLPIEGCYYQVSLYFLQEVARSMNSAACAVEDARNNIARGFSGVARAIEIEQDRLGSSPAFPMIEVKNDDAE